MADNRLRPDPTVFMLFGATGDLSHRLVIPALYRLAIEGLLPDEWRLVGNGRGQASHEDFQQRVRDSLERFGPHPDEGPWDAFRSRLRFAGGGFDAHRPGNLLQTLGEATSEVGPDAGRIFYFAVPPAAFAPLTEAIGSHGLAEGARAVYEKPFGTSVRSFRHLDRIVHETFQESQVYRIDHFLGKEATQDIHVVRFANGLFRSAWNHRHIQSVQIDVPETLDVATRAAFYDGTGAILDMLVTHLFQLAAEVAMEPPPSLQAESIARARAEVTAAFRPLDPEEVVLGQYDGYRSHPGVREGSGTETFVAARLWIDNDRWQGVPFLLRTGKAMAAGCQRVSVIFKESGSATAAPPAEGNVLSFELSGDGEVDLSLIVKEPGVETGLGSAGMTLPLGRAFHTPSLPAYSRLVHDVLIGDRSLFTRPDGLSHTWTVAESLLEAKPAPQPYARGTWGPSNARMLAEPEGWILGE
jgi:glucose-6-phosphate 1-dehydrogenase